MINKILVPLDGTLLAEKALPYAMRLANQCNATILLKRVVFVNYLLNGELLTDRGLEKAQVELGEESETYLARIKELISDPKRKSHLASERVQTLVEQGQPIETIGDLLELERVDFVVMTTHGRTGLGELVLGSTAAGVVQHSSVPVMLIRPDHHSSAHSQPEPTLTDEMSNPVQISLERTQGQGHLLVALDGFEYAEKALPIAVELAKAYGATIHLLEVIAPPVLTGWSYAGFPMEVPEVSLEESRTIAYQYLGKMQARVATQGLECVKAVQDGNPAAKITDYANKIGAMCIVMATHIPGRLAQTFIGSTAQDVLRHTQLPVVMVHPTSHSKGALHTDGAVTATSVTTR